MRFRNVRNTGGASAGCSWSRLTRPVRSALTHALHRDGYEVSTAADGRAALGRAAAETG